MSGMSEKSTSSEQATAERRIFMWNYNKGRDNWSNKISIIFNSINFMHVYIIHSLSKIYVI